MDLKFIKELQELCRMAGLPTEVRDLQEIIDEGRIDVRKPVTSSSFKEIKIFTSKIRGINDSLSDFQIA